MISMMIMMTSGSSYLHQTIVIEIMMISGSSHHSQDQHHYDQHDNHDGIKMMIITTSGSSVCGFHLMEFGANIGFGKRI